MIDQGTQKPVNATPKVFPAFIQIHPAPPNLLPAPPGKRRITMFLDHPVAKRLGQFSWTLAAVALAIKRPWMAVPVGIAVLSGLVIGALNGLRWLFGRPEPGMSRRPGPK